MISWFRKVRNERREKLEAERKLKITPKVRISLCEWGIKMKKPIDYAAIKAGKNDMLKRFLLAKKEAEKKGLVVSKAI